MVQLLPQWVTWVSCLTYVNLTLPIYGLQYEWKFMWRNISKATAREWSTEEAWSHMHIDLSWMWDDQSADQDSGPWDLLWLTQCSESLGRPFLSLFSSRSPALFSVHGNVSCIPLVLLKPTFPTATGRERIKPVLFRIRIHSFFGLTFAWFASLIHPLFSLSTMPHWTANFLT